jgi:isoleucyl-tRNA synthetase
MIEKEIGLNSKAEIEKYGIDKFNQKCRDSVLRYDKE